MDWDCACTSAGDFSTPPRDYAHYTRRHLRGLLDGDDYLPQAAYRFIHSGHDGFSLGVANGRWGKHRFCGFDGSAGTFFCRSILLPEVDFALAIMTNAGRDDGTLPAPDRLTRKLLGRYLGWRWFV